MTNHDSKRFQHQSAVLGLTLGLAWAVAAPSSAIAQGPGTEGGNWTYLGGDAWHTRYAPVSEINVSNFEDLEVAWTFNGGQIQGDHCG